MIAVPYTPSPLHPTNRQAIGTTKVVSATCSPLPGQTASRFVRVPQMTWVVTRSRRDRVDRSHARNSAQPRADLESPRARVPYMFGCEFSPATAVRADAHQSKRTRSLVAYGVDGDRRSSGGTPRSYLGDQVSGVMHWPASLPWIPARRARRMPAVYRSAPSARSLPGTRVTTMCRPHGPRIIASRPGSGRHAVFAHTLRPDGEPTTA